MSMLLTPDLESDERWGVETFLTGASTEDLVDSELPPMMTT
jgi:hypothetical protein